MKISVGIPVYDSKLHFQLAGCLLAEMAVATKMGHELNVCFLPSCTNLAMGRNQIVKEFLESDNDRLIFVDADITFQIGSLIKIAHYPVDLVGGAYRLKQEAESYPIAFMDTEEIWSNNLGLIEMKMIPTGFMSLSREIFEKFRAAYPNREYESRGSKSYCYFQIPYANGALYTEDSYFCEEWRKTGGKVFMAPEITLTHWDANKPYEGHIGNWLRKVMREHKIEEIAKNPHVELTENAHEIAEQLLKGAQI